MKSIKELSEDVLEAWSQGANTTLPSKETRLPWLSAVADIAKMVQKEEISVQDVYDYTKELCSDPYRRSQPQLWSMNFVRSNIYMWVQTGDRKKSFAPPPGFKSHVDHLGRSHVWDWKLGREVISVTSVSEPVPNNTHGLPYVPLAPNERLTKRVGREGYQRDLFLDEDDSDLTEEEVRLLQEMADNE